MTTHSLRDRAIALMKEGRTPDEVHTLFVWEGANPDDVRAVLIELAALQRQAAAMDPERLRGDAMWMFGQGAAVTDVVAHFVRVGVAEDFARPEAERLLAVFRSMRPCQRCGTPTPVKDLVFDLSGFSICNRCNLGDEIHRSEQRALATDLQALGALGGVGGMIAATAVEAATVPVGGTTRPFCAHCRQPTGVAVSALDPAWRARIDPRWAWVCSRCWQRIA